MFHAFRIAVLLAASTLMLFAVAVPPTSAASPETATPSVKETPATPDGKKKADRKAKGRKEDSKRDEMSEDEGKPFDEVVKGFEKVEGLFTLYVNRDKNQALMEIKPEQFDVIYLMNITREAGEGWVFDSGSMLDNFPLVLKRVGKRVQFLHKNVYYRAEDGSPMARALARGVSDSVFASAEMASAPHKETKSVLVDVGAIFLADHARVADMGEWIQTPVSFDRDNSYLGLLKSFPKNTEIEAVLAFTTGKPQTVARRFPDSRSFRHRYRYGISERPEPGFRPRLADDRVGHFLTLHRDYSSMERDTSYVRYVNRWRLEKADPSAALSEPQQPIVFWIENTVPHEHREAVAAGVLAWNRSFEKIGFKNALVVKQQPDDADWDAADVRYSVVRWIVNPDAVYAVGPSYTDPFTGEIYDADIRVSAEVIRYLHREYLEFTGVVSPESLLEPWESDGGIRARFENMRGCRYAEGLKHQMAFGRSALAARGDFENPEALKRYIRDGLVHWMVHEVGHTLGLRHNFRASTIHTLEEMQDETIADTFGITGSVMDYIPVNLAPKGVKQGPYWQTVPGAYDDWAIEYAYKPLEADSPEGELEELRTIARRASTDPKLAYNTDEDTTFFSPDPLSTRFDMGSDPIASFRSRTAIARDLLGKMEAAFEKDGERYQKLMSVFINVLREYGVAAATVPAFVGGVYHYRDHVGDGRLPFEPVSAARQREALAFLHQHIFAPEPFAITPSLLNKLTPERFMDFDWSLYGMPRFTFPIHDWVLAIQSRPLNRFYHPIILRHMLDLPLHYEKGQEALTLAELFRNLRDNFWSELDRGGRNINGFRRNLQRAHLARLMDLTLRTGSAAAAPEDATSLARADLAAIRAKIRSVARERLDAVTLAHLDETEARITAALEARANRPAAAPSGGY